VSERQSGAPDERRSGRSGSERNTMSRQLKLWEHKISGIFLS
jgi:hypothetical protein